MKLSFFCILVSYQFVGLPDASTSLDYTKLPIEVPSGVKDDPKLKGQKTFDLFQVFCVNNFLSVTIIHCSRVQLYELQYVSSLVAT